MINNIKKLSTMLLFLIISLQINAVELNKEFSADAIQISPGQPVLYSKLFVGKKAVRTDRLNNGSKIIEIAYPKKGKRIVLFTEQKQYMEQTGLPKISAWTERNKKSPCIGITDTKCKKLELTKINDVKAEKWQIEKNINGKKYKSLHWIDIKRRIPIKELFHDGGVADLVKMGVTKLQDRTIEKWEYQYLNPTGKRYISRQLYDPELKMVVREEMPGGYLREITNIKIAKQNKSLFSIPQDYKKIKANYKTR